MSSMLYGAVSAKREAAPKGESTASAPPGVGTYIDALAALVPAEVLGLHAVILSFCTKKSEGAKALTEITEPTTLKWAFWGLAVLSAALFLVGRLRSKSSGVGSPNLGVTLLQMLLPPASFVAWTMLLKPSAFDAVASGLATGARDTIAVIAAVVLGVLASQLGYKLDKEDPQEPAQAGKEEPPKIAKVEPEKAEAVEPAKA